MGAPKKPEIQEKALHGFEHFKLLPPPVPAVLHHDDCRGLPCSVEG